MRCILQTQRSECSLACLAMVASAHGMHTDLVELRRRLPVSAKGANLQQLIKYAAATGLTGRLLSVELTELRDLQLPCVLHWDMRHFVVLERVSRSQITILDPAVGRRKVSFEEVSRRFSGVALELTPNADFKPQVAAPRLKLSQLTGRVLGLKRSLAQIFCIALALEAFAIVAPMLNQLVVDEALASGDRELLAILVMGFGLLLLIQTAISFGRSWLVMVLGQTLSLQWTGNLFAHLIRLPVEFFERRHLGDVVSRFGSVGAIQRTLTTSVMEALLDGLMAIAALVMMLVYAPALAAVTCGAVLAYGLLRLASYGPFREAAAERLVISARENTHFLESLRAIAPLKLFGREEERRGRWQNLVVEVQNRDVRTARMNIAFATANTLIFGVENLLVLWLGARMVMASALVVPGASEPVFTIGMLLALGSYKSQFTGRVSALINYAVELKMLNLHAERLADLALATPESDEVPHADLAHLAPTLELRNVSFRYGEGEPWVLKDVNFTAHAGDYVAITGPSGAGKTTLLKIALGLLTPTEGEVRFGGLPIRQIGLSNVRRQIGTVLQEDALLSGSLAENICFFDAEPDQQRIEECAQLAQLHFEIVRMPMGYETLVGDLGTGLSGGQKQRLLLARALYRRPRVLALDEATSHLDIENERAVANALRQLQLTRLIVAHRPETIAGAQRIVQAKDGHVVEVMRHGH